MPDNALLVAVAAIFILIVFKKSAWVVPQKSEYVVERLGKYHTTMGAGFHLLIPFLDKVSYKRSLKEEVMDIPSQICITRDNVSVEVDGVIYLMVVDSKLSSYGIENYKVGASQLAQTSLRSALGRIDLDKTFEERESINQQVVEAVDEAAQNWGVKVLRYEIKDITPPSSVMAAMEGQMKAEREKRAAISISEGDRQSRINRAEGSRQEAIFVSEGEKMKRINEAEGHAKQIELMAEATAQSIRTVAEALAERGGLTAANLQIAEQYIKEFGNIAKEGNTLIVPNNLTDIAGMVGSITTVLESVNAKKE